MCILRCVETFVNSLIAFHRYLKVSSQSFSTCVIIHCGTFVCRALCVVPRKSSPQVQMTCFVNVRTVRTAKNHKPSVRCVYVEKIQGKYLVKTR